jgi:flagellar biosynthesis/type III secretory pathway chaperone
MSTTPPLPIPILAAIAETADLARELLNVLTQEAEALSRMRLKAPTGFAEAKTRLVAAYAYKLEELREVPMDPAAEPALAELRVLNDEVMVAAKHNAAVLAGVMDANRRLIDLVIKAASQQSMPASTGYGRIGNRAKAPKPSDRGNSVLITRKL